jgi:hypothetical protein
MEQVEFAALQGVDWYNHQRLHGSCDKLTPVEYEQTSESPRSLLTEILAHTQVPLQPEAAAERLVRLGWRFDAGEALVLAGAEARGRGRSHLRRRSFGKRPPQIEEPRQRLLVHPAC